MIMEKDEKEIITDEVIDNNTELDDTVEEPTEDETLAQTDEVIPAPEEPVLPEIPVDTIPASENPDVTYANPAEDTLAQTDEVMPVPEDPMDAPLPLPGEEQVEDIPIPAPVDVDTPLSVENPEGIVGPGPEAVDVPVETPEPECPNCDGEGCPTPCVQGDGLSVGQIFGTFQEAVTIIWAYHLKTRKYSAHMALNEFYEKALDIVDDIIETYQGIHGIVEEPFTNNLCADGTSEVEYLNNLRAFVENNKFVLGTDSEIGSVVDDFLGLIDTTLYKLTSFTESNVKSFDEFVYEDYVKESSGWDEEEEEEDEDEYDKWNPKLKKGITYCDELEKLIDKYGGIRYHARSLDLQALTRENIENDYVLDGLDYKEWSSTMSKYGIPVTYELFQAIAFEKDHVLRRKQRLSFKEISKIFSEKMADDEFFEIFMDYLKKGGDKEGKE